jgi:hypothetical protein
VLPLPAVAATHAAGTVRVFRACGVVPAVRSRAHSGWRISAAATSTLGELWRIRVRGSVVETPSRTTTAIPPRFHSRARAPVQSNIRHPYKEPGVWADM